MNPQELAKYVETINSSTGGELIDALNGGKYDVSPLLDPKFLPPGLKRLCVASSNSLKDEYYKLPTGPALDKFEAQSIAKLQGYIESIVEDEGERNNPLILQGPPGSGKTTFIRNLAKSITNVTNGSVFFRHITASQINTNLMTAPMSITGGYDRIAHRFNNGVIHPETEKFLLEKCDDDPDYARHLKLTELSMTDMTKLRALLGSHDGLIFPEVSKDPKNISQSRAEWQKDHWIGKPELSDIACSLLTHHNLVVNIFIDEIGHLPDDRQQVLSSFIGFMGNSTSNTGSPFPDNTPGSYLQHLMLSGKCNQRRLLALAGNETSSDNPLIDMLRSRTLSGTVHLPKNITATTYKAAVLTPALKRTFAHNINGRTGDIKEFIKNPNEHKLRGLLSKTTPPMLDNLLTAVFQLQNHITESIEKASNSDQLYALYGNRLDTLKEGIDEGYGNTLSIRQMQNAIDDISRLSSSMTGNKLEKCILYAFANNIFDKKAADQLMDNPSIKSIFGDLKLSSGNTFLDSVKDFVKSVKYEGATPDDIAPIVTNGILFQSALKSSNANITTQDAERLFATINEYSSINTNTDGPQIIIPELINEGIIKVQECRILELSNNRIAIIMELNKDDLNNEIPEDLCNKAAHFIVNTEPLPKKDIQLINAECFIIAYNNTEPNNNVSFPHFETPPTDENSTSTLHHEQLTVTRSKVEKLINKYGGKKGDAEVKIRKAMVNPAFLPDLIKLASEEPDKGKKYTTFIASPGEHDVKGISFKPFTSK